MCNFTAIHFPFGGIWNLLLHYIVSSNFFGPLRHVWCTVDVLVLSIWDFLNRYVIVHSIGNSGHLITLFLLFILIILWDIDFINYWQVSIAYIAPFHSNRMLLLSRSSAWPIQSSWHWQRRPPASSQTHQNLHHRQFRHHHFHQAEFFNQSLLVWIY